MMSPPAPPMLMAPPPNYPAPPLLTAAPSPRPVVRGQAPEEPELPPLRSLPPNNPTPAIPPMPAMPAIAAAPPLLTLPPPEQLGIAPARPPANALARLEQLGVSCFRLEHTATGGTRVTCLVPTQPGHQRRFEAEAASQDEAVRLVLDQAEAWTKAKQ